MFGIKSKKKRSFINSLSSVYKASDKLYKQHIKSYDNMTLAQVDKLSGEDFELLLASLFTQMGYTVRTTPVTGDYGADLLLFNGSSLTVVQAKRYSKNVGVEAIQEINAARPIYNAPYALVVSNAEFTKNAKLLAQANNVQLVGRAQLANLMRQYFSR